VDEELASLRVRGGYRRQFHPGPPVPPEEIRAKGLSPTSVKAYAYTATPVRPGCDGKHGFCGDDTGAVCSRADGAEIRVVDGRCDHSTCSALK
jgi:hypothetical protein